MLPVMRKLIAIILAALFGLGAGLGSSNLRLRVATMPYCMVARNAELYHGRFIRVRAKVFLGSGVITVYEDCDPTEALAVYVNFDEASLEPSGHWGSLFTDVNSNTKVADAIIEGQFNARQSTGCYGPKFGINARNVELISEFRDYVPPDAHGEVRRVKH